MDRRGERRARRRRGQARCRYVPPRDAQRDDRRTPRALSSRSSRRARAEKSHPRRLTTNPLSFSFFVRAGAWAKILADDAFKAQLSKRSNKDLSDKFRGSNGAAKSPTKPKTPAKAKTPAKTPAKKAKTPAKPAAPAPAAAPTPTRASTRSTPAKAAPAKPKTPAKKTPAKKTPAKSPKAKAVAPKGGVAKKATPAKAKSPVKSPAPKAKKVEEKKGGCVIM